MPNSTSRPGPEARLKADALALGFDEARLTPARLSPVVGERLAAFVAAGRQGEMAWLETTIDRRKSPEAMWPEARTALVVATNYGPDHDPMANLHARTAGNISVYARGRDYHDVLKGRLKTLAQGYAARSGSAVKVFVDTAPLMEKPLAEQAGLGWQGKHTNLVSRRFGSWLFLGVMLTDAVLATDPPETDHCGACRACLDICPTGAFPAPYQLDARRCLSYLTIEHKGPIPPEFRVALGNRIYGCDDCLAVCPWNKFASQARDARLAPGNGQPMASLAELAGLSEAAFRARFAGSPVKRTGHSRFRRNVFIAIGNAGNGALVEPCVIPGLDDPNPLVRGAAVWALWRLDRERFAGEKRARWPGETDPEVRNEWSAA